MGIGSVIFLVIAAVVVFAILAWQAAKKRRAAIAAWAASRGLRFDPGRDYSLDERHRAFKPLHQGSGRYAYNRCHGEWNGHTVTTFDFHYETHSRNSKGRRTTHHHHFSGIMLEVDLPLEPLFIRPEGFFDKLTEFLGFDDIDFESAEFSRRYYVKAENRRWAYDVIHQRTMEFLLSRPRFTIQFDRRTILVCQSGRMDPPKLETAIETASGIIERLPDYAVRQQREKTL